MLLTAKTNDEFYKIVFTIQVEYTKKNNTQHIKKFIYLKIHFWGNFSWQAKFVQKKILYTSFAKVLL